MKASELFTSLLAETPAAADSAPKEAKPRVAAFDAALAAAVDQDGEGQGEPPKSPLALSQPASGRAVPSDGALVLPQAGRSIHGSITHGVLARTNASALAAQLSPLAPQPVADTADQQAVRSFSSGEDAELVATSALGRAEDESEEAAMRAVLGHVAAAIARIVAPGADAAQAEAAAVDVGTQAANDSSTLLAASASPLDGEASLPFSAEAGGGFAVEVRRAQGDNGRDAPNTAQLEVASSSARGFTLERAVPQTTGTDVSAAGGQGVANDVSSLARGAHGGKTGAGARGAASAETSLTAQAVAPSPSGTRAAQASEQGRTASDASSPFVQQSGEPPGLPRATSLRSDGSAREVDGSSSRTAEFNVAPRSAAGTAAIAAPAAGGPKPAASVAARTVGGLVNAANTSAANTSKATASAPNTSAANTSAANMSVASTSVASTSAAHGSAANTSAAHGSAANTSAANTSAANTSAANTTVPNAPAVTGSAANLGTATPLAGGVRGPMSGVAAATTAPTGGRAADGLQTSQQAAADKAVRVLDPSAAAAVAIEPPLANGKPRPDGMQASVGSAQPAAAPHNAGATAALASSDGQTAPNSGGRRGAVQQDSAQSQSQSQSMAGTSQSSAANATQEHGAVARSAGAAHEPQAGEGTGRGRTAAAQPIERDGAELSQPESAQPTLAPGVSALEPGQQAVVLSASSAVAAGSRDGSGPKTQGKSAADPMARVEGFSRGARFGVALSAYGGRGHDSGDNMARGKRSDERERDVTLERAVADVVAPTIDQAPLVQLQPAAREQPQVELAPRLPAVPMAEPPPDMPELDFGRAQVGQPQGASISLHHPDLGPIQIQVQRTLGRIEVSAVIESSHAEAVLRANESGIRLGVQQSGMSFGALRVRVRGEERVREPSRPMQVRRRRATEREI